ncbi:MATH domain and coiled-coil domain-containing protein At3g58370-like [Arachis duranensis]|uniref:MATH domain and coiled-coil domain-containing protein At3g58370-like n=1 Tax=Arachis duranensis TaxID=130453 RepID=A0A6P4CHH2_ARADU|nr:MATH domain and coiled-coil domain-containing protein At3g58370-like [Arachis duranensis]
MENQKKIGETFETFKWTIKDLSKLNTKKIYSQEFFIGGHSWRILMFPKGNKVMFPKGNKVDYLSIYLKVSDAVTLPNGWTRFSKFQLVLINQIDSKLTKAKEAQHTFNARESDWGYTLFIPLADFYDHSKGFIVDDTCIIEAKISVSNQELKKKVDEAAPPASVQVPAKPIEHADNPSSMDMCTISIDELVDFRGLGKIEKSFVPLLDEVCAKHPSVIECQKKRSRRFSEWAFAALGRVLHFLKTKKVRDMDEEACSHLQILWEELETFRFDLTWLEPHVQSALGMKFYMDRCTKVKRVKENVAALEMEMKKLKAMVAAVEIDLETARSELVKVEEGFEERDLDGELGYGP